MLVVLAIGGHALQSPQRSKQSDDADDPIRSLAAMLQGAAARHRFVITHGSGPQVGEAALAGAAAGAPKPLDLLCAELQGGVGYRLCRKLGGRLGDNPIAALMTQAIVDPADPALARPTKPIGPVLDAEAAARLARAHGWAVGEDRGGYRRLIASPKPVGLVELDTVRLLVGAGTAVICAGGGGIPVARDADGTLAGIEAVIDKDHSASLLARELGADALVFVSDVEGVRSAWPPPDGEWLHDVRPETLRGLAFAEGSMGPKVEAACAFVEAGGGFAAIGAMDRLSALLERRGGTIVSA